VFLIDDRRQEPLLDLALNAVIEALRMAPDRYAIIYNNQYDDNHNTAAATLSYSPKLYQTYYNDYALKNSLALKRFLQVLNATNKDSNSSYYKLVITDLRMQGLNGVQFYQILKALDKNIKILFISGLDTAEEIISVLPNVTLNDIIR
jgi:CheY-like chemotaxis protein